MNVDPFFKLANHSGFSGYLDSPVQGVAPFIIEIKQQDAATALLWARDFFRSPCSFDEAWFIGNTVRFFTARFGQQHLNALVKTQLPVTVLAIEFASALTNKRVAQSASMQAAQFISPPKAITQCTSKTLIGIIDDGLPFARADLMLGAKTRVAAIWDQNPNPAFSRNQLGSPPTGWHFGAHVGKRDLNALIKSHRNALGVVNEDAVYRQSDYLRLRHRISHGAFVVGIAAGKSVSRSLCTAKSATKEALVSIEETELAFVQLPKATIEGPTRGALGYHLLNGVLWLLSVGQSAQKIVVVIDYGSYLGPHDASSLFERALDYLIDLNKPKLQVAFATGNAFEQKAALRSHATGSTNNPTRWDWWVPPENEKTTFTEIWLGDDKAADAVTDFLLTVRSPTGQQLTLTRAGEIQSFTITNHARTDVVAAMCLSADRRSVLFQINATKGDGGESIAPSGRWSFSLSANTQSKTAIPLYVYANRGGRSINTPARAYQSRLIARSSDAFVDGSASLIGMGCSNLATVLGGAKQSALRRYGNSSVEQPNYVDLVAANYSSAGPSRGGVRFKQGPNISAVTDESSSLRGILGRGIRSGSSFRLVGTSSAPPQLARLVALRQTLQGSALVSSPPLALNTRLGDFILAYPPPN